MAMRTHPISLPRDSTISGKSRQVKLAPKPGFCVKTTLEKPPGDSYNLSPQLPGPKLFVNFGWDSNVPQPPIATEQEIKEAMEARGDWFVPVLISDLRQTADKAGKPSVVVDAVFHSSLKERCGVDSEFKMFLIQLAFQHIEQQFDCLLSPSIATPNIVSKGKLDSRTVNIPLSLYGLNEEPELVTPASEETPNWSCSIKDGGRTLVVTLSVPRLTERSMIDNATLDLTEPRRISFKVVGLYVLDVDVNRNDVKEFTFDIDGAKCQWIVQERTVVIRIPLLPLSR